MSLAIYIITQTGLIKEKHHLKDHDLNPVTVPTQNVVRIRYAVSVSKNNLVY